MGLIRVILLAGSLFSAPLARAATVETCDQYRGVTVGPYVIQTDYWNQGQCPGTQCMSIDDQTGVFTVTKATYQCGYSVGGYPSILYGKAFGGESPGSGLPARVDSLKCVHSSWTFHPSDTGRWDAAYDIWLCPDNQCGPGGFPGGAEVMVWLDYRNTNGWQVDQGPVTLNGMPWEVWRWDVDDAGGKRTYVAYLAKTKTDSVKNLDLLEFLKDSHARGYLKPSWYLYAVLAGVEIASGGVPFTSESYSVSLNGDCGVAPQILPIPASPTPTPDLTPEDIPPPP
ncbi:MAG TPA: glycoside hydrolase [bacterium]|nr:glycoside hydrolase [bacterium]